MTTQQHIDRLNELEAEAKRLREATAENNRLRREAVVATFTHLGFTEGSTLRHRETGERVQIQVLDAGRVNMPLYALKYTKKGTVSQTRQTVNLDHRCYEDRSRFEFENYELEK